MRGSEIWGRGKPSAKTCNCKLLLPPGEWNRGVRWTAIARLTKLLRCLLLQFVVGAVTRWCYAVHTALCWLRTRPHCHQQNTASTVRRQYQDRPPTDQRQVLLLHCQYFITGRGGIPNIASGVWSVRLPVAVMHPAKAAGQNQMPLCSDTGAAQSNIVFDRSSSRSRKGTFWSKSA